MIKGIDHVVILVKDLDQAVADYNQLGFTVTPGGEHTDGATHNALVAFADGSYLELIAFKRAAPEHRWWQYTQNEEINGEGLVDFALLPTDIASDIAAARQRGLDYTGPSSGGRLRPDGQEIRWQSGQPTTPDLPFLCGDVTPRSLRVPSGPAWIHPNGVTGIEAVVVLVADLAESLKHYEALLGTAPNPKQAATHSATFNLGPGNIVLNEPDTPAAISGPALEARIGPASLQLKSTRSASFDKTLAHNVAFSASS